jgi:Fe-S cluster biogenesis protein NfuA
LTKSLIVITLTSGSNLGEKGALMFIQTQETPNPQSLMFIPGRVVLGEMDPISIESLADASVSPLAQRLFAVDGVDAVFLGNDFITVTKNTQCDWYVLKPHVLGVILEHFVNNYPLIIQSEQAAPSQDRSDDPIFAQIQEIIDTRVRPAVANDGGDIVLHSFIDGIVYLKMKGACAGCPSSTVTLKSGIENMLKFYVPEVLEVQQIHD